jgi:iron-sulfur cluster insertion protein
MMSELVFTDAAARKVGDLIAAESNPKLMLRVYVQGGGCSGLQYGFEFDETLQDGDICVENQGVRLLVDPMSVQYLMGAEIDYREGLDGAQFVIRNPNATTTCGCGSSFTA